jgi:hypothetical protein
MDDKEKQEYLKRFIDFTNAKASSKDDSQRFLVDVGIYTEKGTIRKNYRVDPNSNKCT